MKAENDKNPPGCIGCLLAFLIVSMPIGVVVGFYFLCLYTEIIPETDAKQLRYQQMLGGESGSVLIKSVAIPMEQSRFRDQPSETRVLYLVEATKTGSRFPISWSHHEDVHPAVGETWEVKVTRPHDDVVLFRFVQKMDSTKQ